MIRKFWQGNRFTFQVSQTSLIRRRRRTPKVYRFKFNVLVSLPFCLRSRSHSRSVPPQTSLIRRRRRTRPGETAITRRVRVYRFTFLRRVLSAVGGGLVPEKLLLLGECESIVSRRFRDQWLIGQFHPSSVIRHPKSVIRNP